METITYKDTQVIIAQCTPIGSGAIALIRLSGDHVRTIVDKMCKLAGNVSILEVATHTVNYGWVINANQETIDQVLFMVMDAPRSFTGESTIEITCHNNQLIIQEIIEQAIQLGARLAKPGEFTQRAFTHNKIDLIQAEAIQELITANTYMGLKKSLSQVEGSFSSWISNIEKQLLKALAFCEASFEFLDEEKEFGDIILNITSQILTTISSIKKTFSLQTQIRQGLRITLIGSVNAGKSSVFNALLNQNRAIVTNVAGTTRDVIESGLYFKANYCTLVDTAGIRQTDNKIEQQGIQKSFEEAIKADIILLILDGSRTLTQEEEKIYSTIYETHKNKIIFIKNKNDLLQSSTIFDEDIHVSISGEQKQNLNLLEETIENKIDQLFSTHETPFLLNKRQFNLLLELEKKINELETKFADSIHYELISLHLKDALECISELTGKSISEMSLNTIFKEFCVGK